MQQNGSNAHTQLCVVALLHPKPPQGVQQSLPVIAGTGVGVIVATGVDEGVGTAMVGEGESVVTTGIGVKHLL